MKKIGILIFIVTLFVGIIFAGIFSFGKLSDRLFNFSVNCGEKGSGNVVSEKRDVSEFRSVEVGGMFVVEITAQKDFGIEVEADDNLLPLIKTEVDGETLKIETDKKFSTSSPIRVRISAPDIENLDISGASKVSVVNLNNDSFRIESSGASKIISEGQTVNLTVNMSGASRFDGEKLRSENASIDASGASHASVFVSGDLKTDLSGASKLVYFGNPANLEKKTSGASSVIGK